jgi:hypothetical protein
MLLPAYRDKPKVIGPRPLVELPDVQIPVGMQDIEILPVDGRSFQTYTLDTVFGASNFCAFLPPVPA